MDLLYSVDSPEPEAVALRARALKECIEKLAPMAFELVRQRYHLGQLPEAIAAAVGWTPNSVRTSGYRLTERNDDTIELYEHSVDPMEYDSVAGLPEHDSTVNKLRAMLLVELGSLSPVKIIYATLASSCRAASGF